MSPISDPDQRHGFDHTGEPGTSSFRVDPKPMHDLEPAPVQASRYGTVAAAGPFAGRGGWWSYGNDACGANLDAALPHLDWLAFKYPLDDRGSDDSKAFVRDVVRPKLHGRRLIVWEQDSVVGGPSVLAYEAAGWIGVGESDVAFDLVRGCGWYLDGQGVPVALATTFVPATWPSFAVAMFELYFGDGSPILDNTPLAQLAALGAPAVIPIAGGFGGVSLEQWFAQFRGQGFPGVSAWTVDAFPPENVALLGSLPWAGTDAKAAA